MSNLQHERITVLAQDLRLTALGDLYGGIAQSAANKKDTSYADFLEEVLKAERDARRVRSREMLTRTAGFPALKTLEAYDFAFATGAPRSQIQELAALGFVERAENIVLLGPSGQDASRDRVRADCGSEGLEGPLHDGFRPRHRDGRGLPARKNERGDASRDCGAQDADHRRDRLPAVRTRASQSVLPSGRAALRKGLVDPDLQPRLWQ